MKKKTKTKKIPQMTFTRPNGMKEVFENGKRIAKIFPTDK